MSLIFLYSVKVISFLAIPFLVFFIYKSFKDFKWILLVLPALVFVYAHVIEPQIILVEEREIDLPGENDLKIIVVADFHLGFFKDEKFLKHVVDKVNKLEGDIILMPGDFVFGASQSQLDQLFEPFKDLNAPAFAVLGNHDIKASRGEFLEEEILPKIVNITFVENDSTEIEVNDTKIAIGGIKDFWSQNSDYSIVEKVANKKADISVIMTHNPDAFFTILQEEENTAIDLVVSGHTHGGQVRVPFMYPSWIPTFYKFDHGFYKTEDPAKPDLFITSGVGETTLPIRFMRPPQIDVLNVN
jgi:predicted MPP superfamily phosphohydrolase